MTCVHAQISFLLMYIREFWNQKIFSFSPKKNFRANKQKMSEEDSKEIDDVFRYLAETALSERPCGENHTLSSFFLKYVMPTNVSFETKKKMAWYTHADDVRKES